MKWGGKMLLEQIIGSIQAYFCQVWPVTLYTDKVPTELEIPSLYIPVPSANDADFSKDAYSNLYTQKVNLYAATDSAALLKAEEIAQSIRKKKYIIPIQNEDGSEAGVLLRFSRINTNIIADYTAQVTMTFSVVNSYE